MNHGLSEKTVNKIFSVFNRFPEIEKAVLYGSRAKGNFKTGSDIDLTLYGEKLSSCLLGDIEEALDDLLLPYTIDLSIFDALTHAKLREHIERVGVVFYEKPKQGGFMKVGWEVKKFEEVLEIKNGRNQKIVQKENGKYPIYGSAGNVMGWTNDYICESGTTIVGRKGNINSPIYVETKFWNVDTAFGLSAKKLLNSKFLNYFCIYYDFSVHNKGTTIPSLVKSDLLQILIPIPPLPEQQRIVNILDKVFENIAMAKANTENNLKNARALFDSYLHEVFSQRGEGWEEKTLNEVCIVERGSSPRPIKAFFTNSPNGVNWIKIGDTEQGGKYVYSTAQKITPEGAKQSRYVKEGDFILTNSMSFGRPYIMKIDGYIHDGWFVLRLSESIDTDYFYYLLSSKFVQEQFNNLAAGAIVKNISGDLVKKAILPIPPLAQQQTLVKQFSDFSSETQRLEAIYQRKLAALDELKKALLHQAFNGEL